MGWKVKKQPSLFKRLYHTTEELTSKQNQIKSMANMKLSKVNLQHQSSHLPFYFREDSVGDTGVIQQIFHYQDYNVSHWQQGIQLLAYHQSMSQYSPSLIIDAGANIGASAVYFSQIFSHSLVFAIEPEIDNFNLLKLNTEGMNVVHFNGAISNIDGELALEDPGHSDWGFMTKPIDSSEPESTKGIVKSICPTSILALPETKNTNPLILKIDIEGGEDALFEGDTSWLSKFPLVIIELHDWMLPFSGSSRNFIRAIGQHDFDFIHRGENIFLFNRSILNR